CAGLRWRRWRERGDAVNYDRWRRGGCGCNRPVVGRAWPQYCPSGRTRYGTASQTMQPNRHRGDDGRRLREPGLWLQGWTEFGDNARIDHHRRRRLLDTYQFGSPYTYA